MISGNTPFSGILIVINSGHLMLGGHTRVSILTVTGPI